jgi:hypothetical protein
MPKIVGLFNSQEELGLAIEELAQADLGDIETEVIDNLEDQANQFVGAPTTSVNPAVITPAPVIITTSHKDNLIDRIGVDEEEADFLAQGLKSGASLLVVEVEEKYLGKATEILRQHQGQLFET